MRAIVRNRARRKFCDVDDSCWFNIDERLGFLPGNIRCINHSDITGAEFLHTVASRCAIAQCTMQTRQFLGSRKQAHDRYCSLCQLKSVEGARNYALKPSTSSDRKSTRLNSSHVSISYAVFCLKKKKI